MEPVYLLPAVVAAALTAVGVAERERSRPGALGVLAIGATGLAALIYLVSTHRDGVETSDFILGLVLGTVGLGLLPAAAYWALGRGFAGRRGWLIAIWLVTQGPLVYYLFIVLIFSVDMTHCRPDDYECPL